MAKVKAPLFGFSASGKLGDALVYFGWKGLNVVRTWVIPSNPKTAAQVTQRGYMSTAVAAIHDAQALAANPLDQEDITANAALGSTRPTPRTWFNEIIKLWIDVLVAGNVPIVYADGTVSTTTAGAIDLLIQVEEETGSTLTDGKFYFGSSPTSLIHSAAATIVAGVSAGLTAEDLSGFLTAGNKYYWQFRPDVADGCEGALSGIYSFMAS